ncbi:MAG: hypothetical protein JOZ08_04380 [Verrucomicrobia bacterium]|nr:hypothetical protein [Verrucomicrobiota bacterium]
MNSDSRCIDGRAKRFPKSGWLAAILLILILGLVDTCIALDPARPLAQYRLVRWDEEQGLPQNVLDKIVQTKDGFIWLQCSHGLIRFDGKNFATGADIYANVKLQGRVNGLIPGPSGELWFGSHQSLYCRLPNGEFERFDSKDGLPGNDCTALLLDSKGTLWIWVLQQSLVQLKGGKFQPYPGSSALAQEEIYAMCETSEGLWAATGTGVYRINQASGVITKFTERDGLPGEQVLAVTTDRKGRLWAATQKGLARFDNEGRFQPVVDKIGRRELECMVTGSHGMIWAGGVSGLWRINPETEQVSELPPAPENDRPLQDVVSICEDREGNIWAATNLGLERLSDVKFMTYTVRDGLPNDTINAVASGAPGRIWIGTMNGLASVTNERIESIPLALNRESTAPSDVTSLYEDPQGVLWFGLRDTTLHCLNGNHDQQIATLSNLNHAGPNWATGMYRADNGDLWVATAGAGLQQFRDGKIVKTYTQEDGLHDRVLYSLAVDRDERLWIGGRTGVDSLQRTAIRSSQGDNGPASPRMAFALYADSDGTLWAGTFNGLFRYRNGQWASVPYRPNPRLLGPEFFCLLDDKQGNLWSSGYRGIFCISKSELNDFFDGKRPSVDCRVFGKADGLKSVDCTYGFPQGCRSSDGRLWFATTYGLAVIDPNRLHFNSLPPPMQIERIVADLTQVIPVGAGTQKVELGPGAHQLEFDYAGLSFTAPEKVLFKYRLEGFDKDWIEAGTRREAYYTNLAPGSYQFKVIACNNDGLWALDQTAAATTLTVQPYFYQTVWFYIFCAVAVILFVLLLWRWRLQQILEERTRLARELHDTVARGSVGLVWRLEAAKTVAKKAACEPVLASLDDASRLARENLKETRRAMRALRSGVLDTDRSLPAVLEAVLFRTADGTELQPELKVSGTPFKIGPAWEQALVRIAQESLTNTLKYARAKRFEAELGYLTSELRLRLHDDGIGFDYKPGGHSTGNGTRASDCSLSSGLGLLGIEERSRRLGGKMYVESRPGDGTTIEVVVPRRASTWIRWLFSWVPL